MTTANEASPLLTPPKRTPLPKLQIFILCFLRCTEPVAFSVIFPFVNQMIEDLNITEPSKVPYYSGLIESIFALSTFLSVLPWGRLSDRIGRKPVMILGLCGASVSVIAFGFSRSFWMMVVFRALGGLLNGNVAVIKSMLGEMTDSSNQAVGFSFLPVAWSLGSIAGPIIGGYASNPSKRYPEIFGNIELFKSFPYLLPCMIAGITPALGMIVGAYFLNETLPSKSRKETAIVSSTIPIGAEETDELLNSVANGVGASHAEEVDHLEPTPFRELYTATIFKVLFTYSLLAFIGVSLDALLVLFCYTRTSLGGLSFDESEIGTVLALSGLFAIASQLLLFPFAQHRLGTIRLYRLSLAMYPVVFIIFPLLAHLASIGNRTELWITLVFTLFVKALANMAFGCNMLIVTSASPSRDLLGSMNGVAQMTASLARGFGPVTSSSLFAYSISGGSKSNLVWILFAVLGIGAVLSTKSLREGAGGWREKEKEERDREGQRDTRST